MNRLRVPLLGGAAALLVGIAAVVLAPAVSDPGADPLRRALWFAALYFTATLPLGIAWPRTP